MINAATRPLYSRERDPVLEAWPGAENLAPTGIRSPDRPARSEPLSEIRTKTEILPTTYTDDVKENFHRHSFSRFNHTAFHFRQDIVTSWTQRENTSRTEGPP